LNLTSDLVQVINCFLIITHIPGAVITVHSMGVDKGISFAVPTYYNGNMFYIPISSVTDHITFFQFSDNSRRLLLRWFDQFWKGALSKQSASLLPTIEKTSQKDQMSQRNRPSVSPRNRPSVSRLLRLTVPTSPLFSLVFEVAPSCENHSHSCRISSSNNLFITDGTTWLN
jgi:hypothetical protein